MAAPAKARSRARGVVRTNRKCWTARTILSSFDRDIPPTGTSVRSCACLAWARGRSVEGFPALAYASGFGRSCPHGVDHGLRRPTEISTRRLTGPPCDVGLPAPRCIGRSRQASRGRIRMGRQAGGSWRHGVPRDEMSMGLATQRSLCMDRRRSDDRRHGTPARCRAPNRFGIKPPRC